MIPRDVVARARALLGAGREAVLVEGADAAAWRRALAARGCAAAASAGAADAALVSFVGERGCGPARRRRLAAVRGRLSPGAALVLVDHNRPRQPWRRPLAALALLARGLPPSRDAYPAARELERAGFRVTALRLAAGERRQLVRAVPAASADARSS